MFLLECPLCLGCDHQVCILSSLSNMLHIFKIGLGFILPSSSLFYVAKLESCDLACLTFEWFYVPFYSYSFKNILFFSFFLKKFQYTFNLFLCYLCSPRSEAQSGTAGVGPDVLCSLLTACWTERWVVTSVLFSWMQDSVVKVVHLRGSSAYLGIWVNKGGIALQLYVHTMQCNHWRTQSPPLVPHVETNCAKMHSWMPLW